LIAKNLRRRQHGGNKKAAQKALRGVGKTLQECGLPNRAQEKKENLRGEGPRRKLQLGGVVVRVILASGGGILEVSASQTENMGGGGGGGCMISKHKSSEPADPMGEEN